MFKIHNSKLLAALVRSTMVISFGFVFALAAPAGPPPTEVRPVDNTYHGVKVTDPFRWLEDDKSAEVKAWSAAQNAHARSILDKLPNVAEIRARITEIMSAESASYSSVSFRGGKYYAIKMQPPKQQAMLVVLDSLDNAASERVVVDPNEIDAKGGTTIDWYVVSPDGKLAAVSMSTGGSEAGDVHLFETATGRDTGEVVPQANSGTAGGDLAWQGDSKGFFYTRHPWPGERPESDLGFYQQVYFHKLGTKADDRPLRDGQGLAAHCGDPAPVRRSHGPRAGDGSER